MAMRLNEKASRVLVKFRNRTEAEFENTTIDYANRVVRVVHPGRQIVIPFEAVNMVVMEVSEQ